MRADAIPLGLVVSISNAINLGLRSPRFEAETQDNRGSFAYVRYVQRSCTPPHDSDLGFYSRLRRPRRANSVR